MGKRTDKARNKQKRVKSQASGRKRSGQGKHRFIRYALCSIVLMSLVAFFPAGGINGSGKLVRAM
jgi:hypothetical protein